MLDLITRNSRKKKIQLGVDPYRTPPPSPNTKKHKFANHRFALLRSAAFSVQPANENHQNGDRGGGKKILSFFEVREVTAGCPVGAALAEQVRTK